MSIIFKERHIKAIYPVYSLHQLELDQDFRQWLNKKINDYKTVIYQGNISRFVEFEELLEKHKFHVYIYKILEDNSLSKVELKITDLITTNV